ncbi:MAG: chitinase [Lachnospiraceae bacterium]|nr:chitinase [Lachnospiraceae bacterium]
MKKVIPVIVALLLIGVISYLSFGKKIYERYSYGTERADLNEYFRIYSSSDVPIILQNERIDRSARDIDGHVYLDLDSVDELLTESFYVDSNENLLLYTTGTATYETEIGSDRYTVDSEQSSLGFPICLQKDDKTYIALDYIKNFADFTYEVFTGPKHMQMYTEFGPKKVATIKSDTQVRWFAGIKADILTDVSAGDVVELIEPLDDWMKVKTKDAYIGYVEVSKLTDEREETMDVKAFEPHEYPSFTRDHKINLTWHNIEYPQDGTDLARAVANVRSCNVISPTCFWLSDSEGNITSVANANYCEAARSMGMEVWGLISNFHYGVELNLEKVLCYTSTRRYLVNNIVSEAVLNGLDGVNIDFENVPASIGPDYVQFVREMAVACHKEGLVVSVDHYVPTDYTAHYNRHEQSKYVDYIIIMGYDEHYAGGEAGSVSSISWMEKGISDTLKYVPANKVINAIPFYTRVWKTKNGETTSEAVTMEVANDFLKRNNLTAEKDEATGQNYAEATIGGVLYQVWMEDPMSVTVRLNVIKNAGIAGVASWVLGQETPDIWTLIEAYMNN